jgi:hypothetical protein
MPQGAFKIWDDVVFSNCASQQLLGRNRGKCKSEWSEIGQAFVARNQRCGDSATQKRQKKEWRKFQSTCSEVWNFGLDGISPMQIKGLAIYRFLISGQGLKPSDQWVRKPNVLLAF